MVDWCEFSRDSGKRAEVGTRAAKEPMGEREYKIWATSVKGWMHSEANDTWQKIVKDPAVKKDNNGLNGAQRCWVLKQEVDFSGESTYVDAAVSQKSKPIKNPTNKDIVELEAHLTKVRLHNRRLTDSCISSIGTAGVTPGQAPWFTFCIFLFPQTQKITK